MGGKRVIPRLRRLEEENRIREFANKFKFYMGLNINNDKFTYKHKDKWFYIKKPITSNWIEKHFLGQETVSLPRDDKSKIYYIDIDQRNNSLPTKRIIMALIKHIFKAPPFFIEYNPESKSYHILFKFDRYPNREAWKRLPELIYKYSFFRKHKVIIETIHGKKPIRLPMSKEYSIYGSYNQSSSFGVKRERDLSKILSWFKDKNYGVIPCPKIIKYFDRYIPSNKPVFKEIYKINNSQIKDFFYGAGSRHKKQILIAFDVLKNNGTFEDFVERCEYYNDGTSKDMKQNQDNKLKMLKRIWEWANKNVNLNFIKDNFNNQDMQDKENFKNNKNKYDAVLDILDEIDYQLTDEEREMFHKIIHLHKLYEKYPVKLRNFKIFAERLYVFFYKLNMKYNTKVRGIKYYEKRFEHLNNTVPCSKKLLERAKKRYIIKNFSGVFNKLQEIGLIEIVKDKYGRVASNRGTIFVRHFRVKEILEVYNNLTKEKENIII